MARIFISYSRADSLFVNELVPLLGKAFPDQDIWYDEHIGGGEDWWQRILVEIDRCDLFMYLLSNDSIGSEYCQSEFREALRLRKLCLPVIVRPKTNVDNAPDDLRGEIRRREWIDMAGGFKDARANAALYASISVLLGQIPSQPPAPLTPAPVSQPAVAHRPAQSQGPVRRGPLVVALFGVAAVVIVALIGVIFPLLNGMQVTPTVAPTAGAASQPTAIATVTANQQWTPQTQRFDGVDMVLVPPGCFLIGSENGNNDEQPVTKICFDKPFWIDKYAVTNAQFRRLNGKAERDSEWTGDNRPRESVTWFEARDFCSLRGARLPTEAEWEYTARGPDSLEYPWGNSWDANNAVFSGNSGGETADVGSKPGGVSWVGALDMSGNVWQWISTIYQPYPYSKDDRRERDSDTTSARVLRGGAWDYSEGLLRAALRDRSYPSRTYSAYGIRCARSYD